MTRPFRSSARGTSVQRILTASTLLAVLAVTASPLAAQEQIVTDRPDFTESAVSVDPGRVQLETGLTHTEAGDVEATSFGEVLVRIGWTEALELRLGVNSYVDVDGAGGGDSGFEDSTVGIKLELKRPAQDAAKAVPEIALLLDTTLPTGNAGSSQSGLQPGLIFALGWTLSETLSLGVNFGGSYASAEGERFFEGSGSVALGIALSETWGAYVEYYGFVPESSGGDSTHFANTGLTYLLSDDLQLDLRVGGGLSGDDSDLFVGFGVGYRW